jgi:hypothetical protein
MFYAVWTGILAGLSLLIMLLQQHGIWNRYRKLVGLKRIAYSAILCGQIKSIRTWREVIRSGSTESRVMFPRVVSRKKRAPLYQIEIESVT